MISYLKKPLLVIIKENCGAERMKSWWLEKDMLGFPNETIFTAKQTQDDVVEMIIKDINLT